MSGDRLILEGIVTTLNADGKVNVSPMGPVVDASMSRFVLKPYTTSTTYRNLKRAGQGVFHVTDDVELIARAAVGSPELQPDFVAAPSAIDGRILASACRWYAFRVVSLDDSQERTEITCEVVEHGRLRDFFGFNRAKHAVLEAAILATRTEFLQAAEIVAQFATLEPLVRKTGGAAEQRAFAFLADFVRTHCDAAPPVPSTSDLP
jgi:uncharacterized protein